MPTPPSPTPTCMVFCYLQTLTALDPQAGQATLTVTPAQTFSPPGTGVIVPAAQQQSVSDSYGFCSLEVVVSSVAGIAYLFEIVWTDAITNQVTTYTLGWAQVPSQSQLDLSTVTFTANSDGSN